MNSTDTLADLAAVLEARKQASPDSSYVASLYASGLDRILKKVGEEAAEVLIAAKGDSREELIHEIADLWFHTLVLLVQQELTPQAILDELAQRMGLSGLEEKARRSQPG